MVDKKKPRRERSGRGESGPKGAQELDESSMTNIVVDMPKGNLWGRFSGRKSQDVGSARRFPPTSCDQAPKAVVFFEN